MFNKEQKTHWPGFIETGGGGGGGGGGGSIVGSSRKQKHNKKGRRWLRKKKRDSSNYSMNWWAETELWVIQCVLLTRGLAVIFGRWLKNKERKKNHKNQKKHNFKG